MCVYEKSLGNGFQIGMVVWTGKNIILIVIRPFMNIMALSPLYTVACVCTRPFIFVVITRPFMNITLLLSSGPLVLKECTNTFLIPLSTLQVILENNGGQ